MHSFAKLHVHHFECKASILFTDSQVYLSIAMQVHETEWLWHHSWVNWRCWRLKVLKNVLVSALQGIDLGFVSWQKPDVSVSSRSCGIAGRSWSRTKNHMSGSCLSLV